MIKRHGKIKVIIMEPVQLASDSLVTLLNDTFSSHIDIVKVATTLSEVKMHIVQHSPVDIVLTEAFGIREDYNHWGYFSEFIANNYPETYCVLWSSKPTMFLRRFTAQPLIGRFCQLHKKIGTEQFLRVFNLIIEGKSDFSYNAHLSFGPANANITCMEILILTHFLDGASIKELSALYKKSNKEISAYKLTALRKIGVDTTIKLHHIFINGFYLKNKKTNYKHSRYIGKSINLPIPL